MNKKTAFSLLVFLFAFGALLLPNISFAQSAPEVNITAYPEVIKYTDTVELTWQSKNLSEKATCTGSNFNANNKKQGQSIVTPGLAQIDIQSGIVTYSILCYENGLYAQASVDVKVNFEMEFSANPKQIKSNGGSRLAWKCINAEYGYSEGINFNTNKKLSGLVTVYPNKTTTYGVKCYYKDGSMRISKLQTVIVDDGKTSNTSNYNIGAGNPESFDGGSESGDGLTVSTPKPNNLVGNNFSVEGYNCSDYPVNIDNIFIYIEKNGIPYLNKPVSECINGKFSTNIDIEKIFKSYYVNKSYKEGEKFNLFVREYSVNGKNEVKIPLIYTEKNIPISNDNIGNPIFGKPASYNSIVEAGLALFGINQTLSITSPENNTTVSGNTITVTGTCDSNYPVLAKITGSKMYGTQCTNGQYQFMIDSAMTKPGKVRIMVGQKGTTKKIKSVVVNLVKAGTAVQYSDNNNGDSVITRYPDLGVNGDPCEESERYLTGTIRDFSVPGSNYSQGDFETKDYTPTYIIEDKIGPDKKPVFKDIEITNNGTYQNGSKESFDQWYNDVDGINLSKEHTIKLTDPDGDGVFTYSDNNFFPIDNELFGNEGRNHNYHFTYEIHSKMRAVKGKTFTFTGDDDFWMFINGNLAISIPGIHTPETKTITLNNATMQKLGILNGLTYDIDIFFAERHTSISNFSIETTFNLLEGCDPEIETKPEATITAVPNETYGSEEVDITFACLNSTESEGVNFDSGNKVGNNVLVVGNYPPVTTNYTIICRDYNGQEATATTTVNVLPALSFIMTKAGGPTEEYIKKNYTDKGGTFNGPYTYKVYSELQFKKGPKIPYTEEPSLVTLSGGNPYIYVKDAFGKGEEFIMPLIETGQKSEFGSAQYEFTCNAPLPNLNLKDRYIILNGATVTTDTGRDILWGSNNRFWYDGPVPSNIPELSDNNC